MARRQRYRKRDSDRSGFTYLERELVKDNGYLVGPDEKDRKPPSKKSLGGEGESSEGFVRQNPTSYAAPDAVLIPIKYITAAGGITWSDRVYENSNESLNNGYFHITGSNQAVTISRNPQISSAQHNQKLTIECVDSGVVLSDGSGLSVRGNHFNMDSGAIMNFIYSATDNLWYELSRSHRTKVV